MPTIDENLKMETSFSVGSALTPLLGKTNEGSVRSHLRNHKDKDSRITKTQGLRLVGVCDTPIILCHNKQSSDEHGNACVQEGLTSRYAYYSQVNTSCSNKTPQITFFTLFAYLE
jgi:hypothetical protein